MAKRTASNAADAQPVPIVLTLFRWSRRFIAAFFAIACFSLGWSFTDIHVEGYRLNIDSVSLWQLGLLAVSVTAVSVTLFLRKLARHIDWEMRYYSSLDTLTGLSNRAGLMERLDRPRIAALYLDIDHFKSINDSMGHETGDEVIRVVAQRLKRIVGPSDLAARLGGDEFVIVVEDADAEGAARILAERIRTSLAAPIKAERREIFVTSSIGVAVRSPNLSTPSELLRAADLALYRAKRQGRDRVVFFNESNEVNVIHRLDLERDLWKAMDRGELEMDYLAEVSLQAGTIAGVEALVRWRHPDHGLMRPASFLNMAEETGSVNDIGLWAFETACKDWRGLRRAAGRDLTMSVNLSARQLEDANLARRIEEVLLATDTDPASVRVEVSERVLIDGGAARHVRLEQIRSQGVGVVIDDFGLGHAPLSYLRQWPVDAVKIDRSLIGNLEFDDTKLLIVQAVISLAHDQGMAVTAVGIENPGQLKQLHDLGCDYGQGYYLSKPASAAAMADLLSGKTRRRRPPKKAA